MLSLVPGTPSGHCCVIAVVGHGAGADVYQDGVLAEVIDGLSGSRTPPLTCDDAAAERDLYARPRS